MAKSQKPTNNPNKSKPNQTTVKTAGTPNATYTGSVKSPSNNTTWGSNKGQKSGSDY